MRNVSKVQTLCGDMMPISQKMECTLVLKTDTVKEFLSNPVSEILFKGNAEYRRCDEQQMEKKGLLQFPLARVAFPTSSEGSAQIGIPDIAERGKKHI